MWKEGIEAMSCLTSQEHKNTGFSSVPNGLGVQDQQPQFLKNPQMNQPYCFNKLDGAFTDMKAELN